MQLLIINGTGSITATQENFLVKFLDVDGHRPTITPGSPNTVSVIDNTTVSFDVSTLSKKGDTAVATIDVKNESNAVGARIGLNLTNSNDTYFKVTEHIADTELQAGDITTVTMTVEMLKTPVSADEVTSITATLTANPIENSSATGSDSAEKAVPGLWKLPAGRDATTLQVADELCLNGDTKECFYFIKYDTNNNAVLLAKYNLKVGFIYNSSNNSQIGQYTSADSGYGLQSSDTRGRISDASTYNGTVAFSETQYWMDFNSWSLKSPYNDNNSIYFDSSDMTFKYVSDDTKAYPTIYDPDYVTEPDFTSDCTDSYKNKNCFYTPGYSIAYYVERYKSILEGVGYGARIENARLLLYSEASSLTGTNAISSPTSILRKTSFWFGSSAGKNHLIWSAYSSMSKFSSGVFNNNMNPQVYGVRPVLVISPSNL